MAVSPSGTTCRQAAPLALLASGDEEYGIGTVVKNLSRGLRDRSFEPLVITLQEGSLAEACRQLGATVRVLDLPRSPSFAGGWARASAAMLRKRYWNQMAEARLEACLREHAPSGITVQWPTHLSFVARSAQKVGCRCYWMIPNIISDRWPLSLNKRYYQRICKRYDVIPLPNSRYTGSTLGADRGQQVLYLGVDSNRFEPAQASATRREALGIPSESVALGIFAFLQPRKGQSVVLQAMLDLVDQGKDFHLVLIGSPTEGEYADHLRQLASDRGASNRLHLLGWSEAPEQEYGAVDVAVSSFLGAEAFGLSAVEAMMMRRPVLVHAEGGPSETVLDGKTGWHVAEPSVEGFREGLQRVLADRSAWKAMGAAARQHAVDHFSQEAFVERYLEIVAR